MPHAKSTVIVPVKKQFDLLALHSRNPSRYPYLLQSVAPSTQQTHYDILFACPGNTLHLDSNNILHYNNVSGEEQPLIESNDFLDTFDHYWCREKGVFSHEPALPFQGGWFVYLGYELAAQIEPSLILPASPPSTMPVAFATRIPAAVVVNRTSGESFIVIESDYADCRAVIERDITDTLNNGRVYPDPGTGTDSTIESILEEPAQRYLDAVDRVKQYVRDGDVFQVNLSRLWTATLKQDVTTARLYQRLAKSNPAPFFALITFGEHAIISSSPERLVRVNAGEVETRPIAGTRPRGDSPDSDSANLRELLAHPKERAEHIMLIDLERNDLGRVCVPGSVKVDELMVLETYAHVHHIVSNVRGQLKDNTSPGRVIRAVFPGGTITGCPKVRCMEIIAELEQQARGAYTGSIGYVNHNGNMDFNILIRTLVRQNEHLTFRAGAGIVADSVPEKELQETRAKAKGLMLAL